MVNNAAMTLANNIIIIIIIIISIIIIIIIIVFNFKTNLRKNINTTQASQKIQGSSKLAAYCR